ncbi:hypothetical protein N5D48_17930 [Pseudomonas sp. GD03858]|uniref:hypothetical protein n=1 Tax=unclassified Pseudomonas TaxID=196821 RepID=UPI00244A0779|nr:MULTISPECIES: hypothetical protein [unclassified Pseudomonas]MDH0647340.1 hypothetical protein [Pseudomonas sp. GD03867]MDH0664288.1 hypothetical protein [Pseudomonas sp. GD03858]
MIKINKKPSIDFVRRYAHDVVDGIILPRLTIALKNAPSELSAFFTRARLVQLVATRPKDLESTITDVYAAFPQLAERYCYSMLLTDVKIALEALPEHLSSPKQRQAFDKVLQRTVAALQGLLLTHPALPYTQYLVDQLMADGARSEKRRVLNKLKAASGGTHKFSKEDRARFPDWMKDFADCFDFDTVARRYGELLYALWGLTICPYCAIERIEGYARINVRPDLDHFYPRTRFPFLGVSLFNLIPSCGTCNQKLKRNHPMLGHAHPMLKGLEHDDMFRFGYVPDGNVEQSLSVQVLPLADSHKANNVERFKLAVIYNDNRGLRAWFHDARATLDVLKEARLERQPKVIEAMLQQLVDLNRPSSEVQAQAFKVAAVNDMTGRALRAVLQSP